MTLGKPLTEEGSIVGTFHYLSPEQLEGREADARSDIFALGCVLYEMATAKRAFEGMSRASVIAAIMHGHPRPVSEIRPVPRDVEHLVDRCLEKDRESRWQSALDLAEELRWITTSESSQATGSPRNPTWGHAIALTLAVAAIAAAGTFLWRSRTSESTPPTLRMDFGLPPSTRIENPDTQIVAISRDGQRVAYTVIREGVSRLWVRRTDRFTATPLAGTEGAVMPFFSPDGQWIGFWADNTLKKTAVSAGAPLTICAVPFIRGATWGPGDNIYFSPTTASGIWKVSASGGKPVPITRPDISRDENSHRWPQIRSNNRLWPTSASSDGKFLAYVEQSAATGADIWILSLSDRTRTPFLQSPFNEQSASFSPDGVLLAFEANDSGRNEIYVRGRSGRRWQISVDGGSAPRWSHDGRQLVYWNDGRYYSVEIERGAGLLAGGPIAFKGKVEPAGGGADLAEQYDVAADGRLLVAQVAGSLEISQLHFVTNWSEDVKRITATPR